MASRFETKQDALLSVARQIVSDGGFRDLQMATVASAAGVSVGSVYRYFASKAELCAALVARVSERELQVLEELLAAESGHAERLSAAVSAFARRALQNPRLAYAMIAEPVDEEVDKVRLEYRAAISRAFERLITDGIRKGELMPTSSRTAAACVVGAFMEALVGPLAPDEAHDERARAAFAREIAELCTRMLAGTVVVARIEPRTQAGRTGA